MSNRDLSQADRRADFEAQGNGPWTVIYDEFSDRSGGEETGGSYCALATARESARALQMDSWLVSKGDGGPGFMQSYGEGEPVSTYLPRGDDNEDVELLVLVREFHGAAPRELELDQQFRLFHKLRYVPSSNTYVKMNEDGTQTPAVRLTKDRVEVRTALLKQYIAARQIDLVLFTDTVVYSSQRPASLTSEHIHHPGYHARLDFFEDRFSQREKFGSRYCATKVIKAGPIETCGIWPYEDADDNFPEFIIGEDQHGKPVKFTCDPEKLGNYFGKNPDAPHYLTPVHFRREVLAKYYDQPELYSVEDGYLRCASLWGLRLDNDLEDRVVVFLGDLGRDIPASERDHWRGYMVAADANMSDTNFRRAFLALPTDPAAADLVFRGIYDDASRAWMSRFGWPLFREPKESDVFLLQQLRVPLNDSQNEFEDAVKLLGKLMSDALNEAGIGKALPDKIENEKGISKFERFLAMKGYPHVARDIKYLRRVQELRSKVAAHLKGRDYEAVLTKNLGEARGASAIRNLLEEGATFLRDLIVWTGETEEKASEARLGMPRLDD